MELTLDHEEGRNRQLLTQQHLCRKDKSYLEVMLFDAVVGNHRITNIRKVLSGHF